MFSLIMKFILTPSLEHMTLVQIGISLWNQNDVRALISKLAYFYLYQSKWQKIEERVIEKVSQLSLPQSLKEKVFGVIKPIGIQIFEWMQYYYEYLLRIRFQSLDFPTYPPVELCWTPHGIIDRKRTVEVLVRDENLNIALCYRLACDYILEDDIIRFWNNLHQNVKDYDWSRFPVINFWSHNMKTGGVGHISYKDVFISSVRDSSKVAAKYFLRKLTPQDREECLEELAKKICVVDDADVLCFLLTEMEEEQQMLVFKSDPFGVLLCLLKWPWQSFFIEVANCMWDFISEDSYDKILREILSKVTDGFKDYNYQKLFRDFWQISPRALKDSLIEEIDNSSLLEYLFDITDKENIRLILKDATLTAKSKLIYNDNICYYLTSSIRENEWDFLEFFIRECLPSKNEMLKFKVEFEKHFMQSGVKNVENKHKWDEIFCDSFYL